ncbi:uncharacterized protein [Elaeis guineensis]|uniref:uncharacterized protein n=1 Tax=Elaeis guineensis var. tenera TaxID=51953 RepID=UPI003C6DAD73
MGLPPVPPFYGVNGRDSGDDGRLPTSSRHPRRSSPVATAGGRYGYDRFLFQWLGQQARQVFETLLILHLELGASATCRAASSASARTATLPSSPAAPSALAPSTVGADSPASSWAHPGRQSN